MFTEKADLVLFGLEIGQFLVGQNEVKEDQPDAHEIERVFFSVAEVVFFNLPINGPGKEMIDGTPSHVIADGGVTLLEKLLGKRGRTLSVRTSREDPEVSQSEVAREHRYDVKKAGFRFGVAEFSNPFDVSSRNIHRDKISAVNCFTVAKTHLEH